MNSGSRSRYEGGWQDSVSRTLEQDGSNWYAGLRLNMPLQNRAARAQYLDAAAQDKQSLYRLRRVEVSAETAIRSAHALLELAATRARGLPSRAATPAAVHMRPRASS